MNKRAPEKWEIRLGIAQVIILLGVVTGCMTFAFYLGFFSGKRIGFDVAMDTNAASSVKIPIGSDHGEDALHKTEQAVSEVYARLNERNRDVKAGAEKPQDVPALASIKESQNIDPVDAAPQPQAINPSQEHGQAPLGDPWENKPHAPDNGNQRVLGDEEPAPHPAAENKVNDAAASLFEEDSHKAEKVEPKKAEETDSKKEADLKREEAARQAEEKRALEEKKALEEKRALEEKKALEEKRAEEKKAEAARKLEEKKALDEKKTEEKLAKKKEAASLAQANAAESAGITRGVIPSGWFAQVAAPTKKSEAESLAAKLKQSGFHVVVENAKVRGDEYFRILVGPEANRAQAEALVGQLRRETYLKGVPFIRMVK